MRYITVCLLSFFLCVLQAFPQALSQDNGAFKAPCLDKTQSATAFKDVTIIVSSCDKYSDLWPSFFACLFRSWPWLEGSKSAVPIILVAGQKDFAHKRVITHKIGRDKGWSANLLEVLSQVKTPYVLYLQEDYFFCKPVQKGRLKQVVNLMDTSPKVVYCQLSEDVIFFPPNGRFVEKKPFKMKGILKKTCYARSRNNLQAALWRKDALQTLLRRHENPWQFEKNGNKRSQYMEAVTGATFLIAQDPSPLLYLNAVYKGAIDPRVLCWLQKNKLPIPKTDAYPLHQGPYCRQTTEPKAYAALQSSGCCDNNTAP